MKSKLKKYIIVLASLFFVFLSFIFIYVKKDSAAIETEKNTSIENVQPNLADGFKLGVVGDSWVVENKLNPSITQALVGNGFDVDVRSYSLPGRKSGEIYEDMTSENLDSISNNVVKNKEVDAILVVAGVNDTAGHIGEKIGEEILVSLTSLE